MLREGGKKIFFSLETVVKKMPRIFKEEGTWVKGGRNKNTGVLLLV